MAAFPENEIPVLRPYYNPSKPGEFESSTPSAVARAMERLIVSGTSTQGGVTTTTSIETPDAKHVDEARKAVNAFVGHSSTSKMFETLHGDSGVYRQITRRRFDQALNDGIDTIIPSPNAPP